MRSILIVAGEKSSEAYGARLIRSFRRRNPEFYFFGVGGKDMEAEGAEILVPIEHLNVVGIHEALVRLPRIRRIFSRLRKEIEARSPAAAVLIDSPDFNLRLARVLKKNSIPVLYYISPTIWAWRKGRTKIIKKNVDKMLLIFPFEKAIYDREGIPAVFVGHPLREKIRVAFGREEFFRKHGFDPGRRLITLLPGSRPSELQSHLPVLAKALPLLEDRLGAQFCLIKAESLNISCLRGLIPENAPRLKVLDLDGYEAMAASDLILSACGTANMEACLIGTPFIAFYRLSPLSYWLALLLVKVRHYSIVNILAGKAVVPELIQRRFNPDELVREACQLIESEERRSRMTMEFARIARALGDEPASENAGRELERIILQGDSRRVPISPSSPAGRPPSPH